MKRKKPKLTSVFHETSPNSIFISSWNQAVVCSKAMSSILCEKHFIGSFWIAVPAPVFTHVPWRETGYNSLTLLVIHVLQGRYIHVLQLFTCCRLITFLNSVKVTFFPHKRPSLIARLVLLTLARSQHLKPTYILTITLANKKTAFFSLF